jgi:hypothetical protein
MNAFAATVDKETWLAKWLAKCFLPLLGILITVPTIISLVIAFMAIHHFRKVESDIERRPFPDVPKRYHWVGMAAPATLPFIILGAWIFAWLRQP